MKAQLRLKNSFIEVQGETQKQLFLAMSQAFEVFNETTCGLCKSENIRPVVRTVTSGKKIFDYHEYHCLDCRARLALGQNLEGGTLFPIRKLNDKNQPDRENGKYGKHNGWHKYTPEQDGKE